MATGWQIEDSCTCSDPLWTWEGGPFDESCTAHPALLRDVLAALNGWLNDLPESPTDVAQQRFQKSALALLHLACQHWRHDPPGPAPSPTGSCGACGGTGEVFRGWATEGGPIFDGECGCMTAFCGGCGENWPCEVLKVVAEAVGVAVPEVSP